MILTMIQTMTWPLMKKRPSSIAFQIIETVFMDWLFQNATFDTLHNI